MVNPSPADFPMKLYRAVYKESNEKESNLDLFAKDLATATLSASELIPTTATLIHIFHNPDW